MKIIKINSITDTRSFEEIGEKWVPIPNSGDSKPCDFCGRLHEVHAIVELEDNTIASVGTGCMKKTDSETAKKLESGARLARKISILNKKIINEKDLLEKSNEKWGIVNSLVIPEITIIEEEVTLKVGRNKGEKELMRFISIGDRKFRVWAGLTKLNNDELKAHGMRKWKDMRMSELCGNNWEIKDPKRIERKIANLQEDLEIAENKLTELNQ